MKKRLLILGLFPACAVAGVSVPQVPVPATHPITTPAVPTLPQTRQELDTAHSTMTAQTTEARNPAATLPPLPPESTLYQSAANSLLPIKPQDLMRFRKRLQATQKASEVPITPPLAKTEVITVHPNRGGIPVIPMAAGYVTDISFVDEWGQPWFVDDATVGNGAAFQVVNPVTPGAIQTESALENKEGKSAASGAAQVRTSTIIVAAKQKFRDSNLSVLLHQLPTPLLFNLQTGTKQVDYRIIVRVDGLPAGAMPPVGGLGRSHDGADAILMRALYDTMPQAAHPIPFGYGEAWTLNGKVWLRTRHSVLAPAWIATLQSPDGVHAYELPATETAMLTIDGEPQTIVFQKGEGHE
jgi:intracellular multiplication protein IcmK